MGCCMRVQLCRRAEGKKQKKRWGAAEMADGGRRRRPQEVAALVRFGAAVRGDDIRRPVSGEAEGAVLLLK